MDAAPRLRPSQPPQCAVERCSECYIDDASPNGQRCAYCLDGYELSEDGSRCVEAKKEAA